MYLIPGQHDNIETYDVPSVYVVYIYLIAKFNVLAVNQNNLFPTETFLNCTFLPFIYYFIANKIYTLTIKNFTQIITYELQKIYILKSGTPFETFGPNQKELFPKLFWKKQQVYLNTCTHLDVFIVKEPQKAYYYIKIKTILKKLNDDCILLAIRQPRKERISLHTL